MPTSYTSVVPRRLVDECRLIVVDCVEIDRHGLVIETQVSMKAVGELSQALGGVSVELLGQYLIRDDAERCEQQAEHDRGDRGQPGAQRQGHDGASVSTYPTPRTV